MKRSLTLFLVPLVAAPLLFGQGSGTVDSPATPAAPTAPTPSERPEPLPLLPPLPAPSATTQGIPLIPQAPSVDGAGQTTEQTAGKKKKKPVLPSRTEAAEDAMQLHIKLRAAKTKALEDPAIQAELAKVNATKTDYDRREVYKRYYVLLYARMLQIDPTLATGISTREGLSILRNYQLHITPTVPIDQIAQSKPTGPENAMGAAGGGGTPIPRRSFGQARIGSF